MSHKLESPYEKHLALSLLILFISCATAFKPIDQNEPIDTQIGFKIKTPPNDPWYRLKTDNGSGFILGREPSSQDKKDGSTIIAEVHFGFIDSSGLAIKTSNDALKLFEKDMTDPSNTNRFENNKNQFARTKFKNADCMTFDQSGIDKVAKSFQGERMAMSFRGILCLHPKDQSRYIRLSLSQRLPVSRNFINLTSDEKAFYSSLEFTDLKVSPPK